MEAIIYLNGVGKVTHNFGDATVKQVFKACQKHLGKCIGSYYLNHANQLWWDFTQGSVYLANTHVHHGYRTKKSAYKTI